MLKAKKKVYLIIYLYFVLFYFYSFLYNSYAETKGVVYFSSNKEIIKNDEEVESSLNIENTNLEILAIENILLNPSFDSNITDYDVDVANEQTNLNILAIPENEKATVEIIGNKELKEGNNLINVNVIAQDGISKKEYKINAHRRNNNEEKKYQEEQQVNNEKLKEIYEAERTSISPSENNQAINELQADSNNFNKNGNENSNKLILVMLLFWGLFFIVLYIIPKQKRIK